MKVKVKDDKRFHKLHSLHGCNRPSSCDVCMLCGPQNCGKTYTAHRIMHEHMPMIEYSILIHCDGAECTEYDTGTFDEVYSEIPKKSELDHLKSENLHSKSKCIIIDEYNFDGVDTNFYNIVKFIASHSNCLVIYTVHNFCNIPTKIRGCTNWFYIWPSYEKQQNINYKNKLGVDVEEVMDVIRSKFPTTTHTHFAYHSGMHTGHTYLYDGQHAVPGKCRPSCTTCHAPKPHNLTGIKRRLQREQVLKKCSRRKRTRSSSSSES